MENSLSLSVNDSKTLISTKELAEQLKTSKDVIIANAKKCIPNKVFVQGKATYWNNAEITVLLDYMKSHTSNNRSVELNSTVANSSTELTPALKIKKAFDLMQEGYQEELERLKLENAQKQNQIEELTPDAESWRNFVDSDGTFTASNVAKLLHISRDNDLIPFLLLKKYIMRERHDNPNHAGNLVGTALGIERGYIKNYLYTNNKISRVQFKITPEGMQKIEKAFCHNELTPSEQRRVNALCQEAERKMKPTSIGRAE